jgi:hypothetical protein
MHSSGAACAAEIQTLARRNAKEHLINASGYAGGDEAA